MGIKENFSQAVKELWKKDGLEDKGDNSADRGAQPTELDKYLAQQDNSGSGEQTQPIQQSAPAQQSQPIQQSAPVQQSVPAQPETPDPQSQPVQQNQQFRQEPPPQQSRPAQQSQPYNRGSETVYGEQSTVNANAANAAGMSNSGSYGGGSGGNVPPAQNGGMSIDAPSDTDEVTVISKNTLIDGNIRSLANMRVDGDVKGNIETTRNLDMSGKVVGDIVCNNANFNSAAMQGNAMLKGKMRMDRDTILMGDLTSQYADVNGRIRGKLEITGKAELKRDAIVFGDINASTIAVTDGAIIQGYVNTTFLSKEDSRNVFPEAIALDTKDGTGVS